MICLKYKEVLNIFMVFKPIFSFKMKSTPLILQGLFHFTNIDQARYYANVSQYGLKPVSTNHFAHPTMLVNYGRATSMEWIGQRRAPRKERGSSPTIDGLPMGKEVSDMLGIAKQHKNSPASSNNLQFCSSEISTLKICIARGNSECERESLSLQRCLRQSQPLIKSIEDVGDQYLDWFIQNVSDNATREFRHTPGNMEIRYQRAQHARARGLKQYSWYNHGSTLAKGGYSPNSQRDPWRKH